MSESSSRTPTATHLALERTLLSTAPGREFLADYARRCRTQEMTALHEAVRKLEKATLSPAHADRNPPITLEVDAIAARIAEAKLAILREASAAVATGDVARIVFVALDALRDCEGRIARIASGDAPLAGLAAAAGDVSMPDDPERTAPAEVPVTVAMIEALSFEKKSVLFA